MSDVPVNTLPHPSRERIVELLRWQQLTVEELGREVALTANGVRAQLAALERDGTVWKVGIRPAGGAGKPPTVYGLTAAGEQTLSNAYPLALAVLMASLRQQLSNERLIVVLADAGEKAASGLATRDAAAALEALGATVRRTMRPDGDEEIEGAACPLATGVVEDPRTCELVRSLLATTTGRDVAMCCHHGDHPRCRFVVKGAEQ